MTNKQAKRSNQPRQHKKGAHTRARKRRNQHLRCNARARVRNIKKNPPKQIQQQIQQDEKESLKWRVIKWWAKVQCSVGLHKWNLSSGLSGTPKFVCRRCLKKSKTLWPVK